MADMYSSSAVLQVTGDRNIPLMDALLELQMRQPEILSGLVEVIPQLLQNNGYEAASKFLDCSFEL